MFRLFSSRLRILQPINPRRRNIQLSSLYKNSNTRVHVVAMVILAGVALVAGSGAAYSYWVSLSPYPKEVARHLRLALYHSEHAVDYPRAIRHYNDAIKTAREHNLDPRKDPVAGIRIKLAYLYKSLGKYENARAILESLLADTQHLSSKENNILLGARAVRIAISLADIEVKLKNYKSADNYFNRAIYTLLLYQERKQPLLSRDETIALLSIAAEYFRHTNRPTLATPLFLKALDLIDSPNCNSAYLMNSIAATIAAADSVSSDSSTFAQRQAAAKSWAEKAIEQAKSVPRPLKNQSCNQTCATANINLAIIADTLRNRNEAIVRLEDAKFWAKKCFNEDINKQIKLLEQQLNHKA